MITYESLTEAQLRLLQDMRYNKILVSAEIDSLDPSLIHYIRNGYYGLTLMGRKHVEQYQRGGLSEGWLAETFKRDAAEREATCPHCGHRPSST